MGGNRTGGLAAAKTNKENDPDFYKKIGSMGGKRKVPKGFALNKELARTAGAKGGRISVRPSKK